MVDGVEVVVHGVKELVAGKAEVVGVAAVVGGGRVAKHVCYEVCVLSLLGVCVITVKCVCCHC